MGSEDEEEILARLWRHREEEGVGRDRASRGSTRAVVMALFIMVDSK